MSSSSNEKSADDKAARFAEAEAERAKVEMLCHRCGTYDVEPEDYCYGCKSYICELCNNDDPLEDHSPEDHDLFEDDEWWNDDDLGDLDEEDEAEEIVDAPPQEL